MEYITILIFILTSKITHSKFTEFITFNYGSETNYIKKRNKVIVFVIL